jgi:hypothetical protein
MVMVDYNMFMYAKADIRLLPGHFMYSATAKTAANKAEMESLRQDLRSPGSLLVRLSIHWDMINLVSLFGGSLGNSFVG